MKLALKNLLTKALIAIIALQIINLAIDTAEFQPLEYAFAIGEFNYFNSITEFVAEAILGNKDAFPEFQKERTASKSQMAKHLSLKIFGNSTDEINANFTACKSPFIVLLKEKYAYIFFNEINPPPPKIA